MSNINLDTATPEEIAEALLAAREGLAYDVGMLLWQRDASKEFPGPDPYDINPKSPNRGEVRVTSYDPARREDALRAFREIWGPAEPSYDPDDPKWLKATKAERRAAKRAVEEWPRRDQAPNFLASIDRHRGDPHWGGWCSSSDADGAPQTRAEAEAEAARWASFGVTAEVCGFEEPDKSHRRSLRELGRPIG